MKNSIEISKQLTVCQSNSQLQKATFDNLAQSVQINSPLQANILSHSLPITPNNGDQADLIQEIGLPKILTRKMTRNDYSTTANGHKTKQEVFCNNCQRINMTRLETEYGLGAMQVIVYLLLILMYVLANCSILATLLVALCFKIMLRHNPLLPILQLSCRKNSLYILLILQCKLQQLQRGIPQKRNIVQLLYVNNFLDSIFIICIQYIQCKINIQKLQFVILGQQLITTIR